MPRPLFMQSIGIWPALCSALGTVISLELIGETSTAPSVFAAPADTWQDDQKPDLVEFQAPPADVVGVAMARPLFLPSRRPYVPPVEMAPQVEEVTIQLVGVLLTGPQHAALVRLGTRERAVWVREGGWLSSWQVEKIVADRFYLRRRDEVRVVKLHPDLPIDPAS
jgi:hypothetical protein